MTEFIFFMVPIITGYVVGTIVERLRWNSLIQSGKLPKPGMNWAPISLKHVEPRD